jgi:DNA-binding transcriptional regulator YiaG
MNCPNDHGEKRIVRNAEAAVFRGKQLQVLSEHYVCPDWGLKVDDLPLAAKNQKALSDAHRKSMNLLTGDDIVKGRRNKNWSQEDLEKAINVGIASIKRWEKGQIQTRPMDDVLRRAFQNGVQYCNPYTGNRVLSLARIKLVLEAFSERLGRNCSGRETGYYMPQSTCGIRT